MAQNSKIRWSILVLKKKDFGVVKALTLEQTKALKYTKAYAAKELLSWLF